MTTSRFDRPRFARLSPSARLMLLTLHGMEGEEVEAGQQLLAKRTGLSVRSVATAMGELLASGFIEISAPARRGKPATYSLKGNN